MGLGSSCKESRNYLYLLVLVPLCFEQKITLADRATNVGLQYLSLHCQCKELLQPQTMLDDASSGVFRSLE